MWIDELMVPSSANCSARVWPLQCSPLAQSVRSSASSDAIGMRVLGILQDKHKQKSA
jgi:hypothetical protein